MENQILSEEFKRMQKLAGIVNENEIKENPEIKRAEPKTAEVLNIEKFFATNATLRNALRQINTEVEYRQVIAALHLYFPDAFKKNMSVQAVSTRLKLDPETPPPTAP